MAELGELAKHQAEFKALDVQLVAISVDPPDKAAWAKAKVGASFPFLSDAKQQVMQRYGIMSPEYKNKLGLSVNTPTLVLVDRAGTIRWIHQTTNFRVRASIAEDLAAVRKLR